MVLASASPRRKQLMVFARRLRTTNGQAQIGLHDVEVRVSGFAESLDKRLFSPFEYVAENARGKCLTCYQAILDGEVAPALVIAADTIVLAGLHILEKPRGPDENFRMLKMLRDLAGPHKVFTAVACLAPYVEPISPGYVLEMQCEETQVTFDAGLTDDFLSAYVKTGESVDAAGGYCIQGLGSLLVDRIEGDYNNVVGLPLRLLIKTMEETLEKSRRKHAEEEEEEE